MYSKINLVIEFDVSTSMMYPFKTGPAKFYIDIWIY